MHFLSIYYFPHLQAKIVVRDFALGSLPAMSPMPYVTAAFTYCIHQVMTPTQLVQT